MLIISEDSVWVESLDLGDADVVTSSFAQVGDTSSATAHDLVVVNSRDPETALDQCRKLRPYLHGALVLYTDVPDEAYQHQAYAAGVNECVLKPIAQGLLAAKLAAWRRRIELDRHVYMH